MVFHRFGLFNPRFNREVAINKVIEASQRMLKVNSQGELGGMSPPLKRHLELEIKALENAPRDADKLRRLLQVKASQKEEAMHVEDTQRLVTEIEMLKVVLFLVCSFPVTFCVILCHLVYQKLNSRFDDISKIYIDIHMHT